MYIERDLRYRHRKRKKYAYLKEIMKYLLLLYNLIECVKLIEVILYVENSDDEAFS
jgi:hypothetical protein